MARETQNTRQYFSHSLARGLAVIRAFGRDAPTLRITDVAARTGLDRAAARRFLLTLVDLNYVGVSGDLFYLRPSALDIGFSYLSSLDPNRLVQPFLNELTDKTRETSSFGILDDFQVRLLARSANNRILNFSIYLGERVPAYRTALGRVLLAGLPEEQFDAYWADLPRQLLMASASLDKTEGRRCSGSRARLGSNRTDDGGGVCRDSGTNSESSWASYRSRERYGVSDPHQYANKAEKIFAATQGLCAANPISAHCLAALDDCADGQ